VKTFLRIADIVAGGFGILALCVWLNVPYSLVLLAQAIGSQRQPVTFDVEYTGLRPEVRSLRVVLYYFPKTPIYGVTQHYWSIIAPPHIDNIVRSVDVPVHGGRAAWSAPYALLGLSNYRLQIVTAGEQSSPYAFEFGTAVDQAAGPRGLDIPLIAVTEGDYRFDGALALWRRPNDDDVNPYVYSPAVDEVTREIIWGGLRSMRMHFDLAPYALSTFVVPADWNGDGWKNEAYRLTRHGATLTDKGLDVDAGETLALPFARQCKAAPQVTVVGAGHIPHWSRLSGLWRPVPRAAWELVTKAPSAPGLQLTFVPGARGAPDIHVPERFTLTARKAAGYRILAACPNPHYQSVAVTWLDVSVHPAGKH
jgi:hypothetical protein